MLANNSIFTPSAVTAGNLAQRFQLRGPAPVLLGFVTIAGDRLLVGLQDHEALVAVDDDQIAA